MHNRLLFFPLFISLLFTMAGHTKAVSAAMALSMAAFAASVMLFLRGNYHINRFNDIDQIGVDTNGMLVDGNPCTEAVLLPGGKYGYVNAHEGSACAARNVTQYASDIKPQVLAFDKHKDLLTASQESQYKFDLDLMNSTQYNYVEGTELLSPSSMCWDATGRYMFIVDTENHLVFRHDHAGNRATIHIAGIYDSGTGIGIPGDEARNDGGGGYPSTSTFLSSPTDCAVDSGNNLYIADSGNGRILSIVNTGGAVPDGTTPVSVLASDSGKGRKVPGMTKPYRLLYKDTSGIGGIGDVLFVTEHDNRMIYAIGNLSLPNSHETTMVYQVAGLLQSKFYTPWEHITTVTSGISLTIDDSGFPSGHQNFRNAFVCRKDSDGYIEIQFAAQVTEHLVDQTITLPLNCQPQHNELVNIPYTTTAGAHGSCLATIYGSDSPDVGLAGKIELLATCSIDADAVLYGTAISYHQLTGTSPASSNSPLQVTTISPALGARAFYGDALGQYYSRCDDISAVPGAARDIAVVCRTDRGESWIDHFVIDYAAYKHPATGGNVGLLSSTVTRIAGAGVGLGLGKAIYTADSITGITAQMTRAESMVIIDSTHMYVASDAYYNPLTGVASGLGLFKFNTLTQASNMSYIGGAAKLAPPTSTVHYGGNRLKDMTLQIRTVRARPTEANKLYMALPFNNTVAYVATNNVEFPVTLEVGAFNYRNITTHGTAPIPICKNPVASTYNATGDTHYLACYEGHVTRIYKITAMAARSVFAHTGAGNKAQWGVTAANVFLGKVGGMIATSRGDLIVSDETTNRVVKIKIDGATTTTHVLVNLLGTQGTNTIAEGTVNATGALLNEPSGLCMDSVGGVYIADASNHAVRYLNGTSTAAGAYLTVTTVVGLPGSAGRGQDNSVALLTKLNRPTRLLCASDGRVWISDAGNNRIVIYNPTTNRTTVYGEYMTDAANVIGSPAELTRFGDVGEMVEDSTTLTVYIAEGDNGIRAITNTSGVCMTGVCMPCSGDQCPKTITYANNHGYDTIDKWTGGYYAIFAASVALFAFWFVKLSQSSSST